LHICTFTHLHIAHFCSLKMYNRTFFCSLKMCKCASAHFVALKKCGNVRSHILSLFKNVQMCDRSLCRSLKKCDCTIALLKWANVWKCAKKMQISKLHFFCTLKRAITENVWSSFFKSQRSVNRKLHFYALFCIFLHIFKHSPFLKEQLCDCTFLCSLKICECAIAHFSAL